MRSIEPALTKELAKHYGSDAVPHGTGYPITGFRQLVEHVARLAYMNKDHLLFFRGQGRDYQNKAGGTTIYPTIYRGDPLPQRELDYRFDMLKRAGRLLADLMAEAKIDGHRELARRQLVQLSILQHYEVLPTPLLDITQSLRVACSFAQLSSEDDYCFVYVLGLPYLTNRISVNSEQEIVNVRLLSICPPDALRPYFQEGYLAGTEDVTTDFESKSELDFSSRLIAKFRISQFERFWGHGFSMIPKTSLYPKHDGIEEICQDVKARLKTAFDEGNLGQFIKEWALLEAGIVARARRHTERDLSVGPAVDILARTRQIPSELASDLHRIRHFRNQAIHRPAEVTATQLGQFTARTRDALNRLGDDSA